MPRLQVWSSPISLHVYWPELDLGFLIDPAIGAWWTSRGDVVGRMHVGRA
jgi:hypothetical protein